MTDNNLPKFKHLATETLVTLHREVGQELKMREGFPKIDFPASHVAEEEKNVQMLGRLLPLDKLVTDYPTSLDTFAELAKLLPLPEKDISDLVEILKRHNDHGDKLSQLVDDVASGKKLIPVVKGPIAQLNERFPRPSQVDPGLDGDVVSVHGYCARNPDLMRASKVAQHQPTMAEFIEEGLELRRTAKDHMLAAEEERLTMEQRFIPWVGSVEVGTSMVLALKHGTGGPAQAAWILLLQNLRAGSMISIVHPHWGETQTPVPVESVNFYDKDKGWQNVVMLIAVKDPAKPDQPAVKFYTSLNEELLDEHMVPVVNHEWIKIQPVSE